MAAAAPRPPSVVVVGAGIVGSAIAFHLSRRGARVTILDSGEPGQAASRVSFAWINARDKSPRGYHDLNRRSLDIWPRFERLLDADLGLTWGGELRWTATDSGAAELRERVLILQSWGYPIREIRPDELHDMEPGLVADPVTSATYTEIDGHADTGRVIEVCLQRARELGANVHANSPVKGFQTEIARGGSTRVVAVETEQATVECDAVVLAAGTGATHIADMVGIKLPQARSPGATVITECGRPETGRRHDRYL